MLQKRIATALDVLRQEGLPGVARVSAERAGMWWRHGAPLEFGKFVGRPTEVARLDGCRFALSAPAVSESMRYLLLSGKHEAPERSLISRFVDPALPIVEFGAAFGVVSCIANALLDRPHEHVAIEANPELMSILGINRDLNGSRFTMLNRVVGYETAVMTFPVATNVLASSVHVTTDHVVKVPATSLERILREHGFSRCTLICDIEGAEVDLVRQESTTIAAHVETLIMEVHERLVGAGKIARMMATLHDAGFDLLDRAWDTVVLGRARGNAAARTGREGR